MCSHETISLAPPNCTCVCRDHLLSSYAASVSRELTADAVKLNLDSPTDKAQSAALARNASMLQRMKSLLNSRN